MIDTVRFEQERKFRNGRIHHGLLTLDRKSNLRVDCKGDRIKAVEVSLPKLLFGTNSKLISTQQELDNALQQVDLLLEEFVEPATHPRIFKRVDLVWHFEARSPQNFFFAHQHCNHPEIKKCVAVYRNHHVVTGVEWQGDRMKIKMYDKTNREVSLPRQVVRVEIELRGEKLKNKLENGRIVDSLTLKDCYECYRATLRKFRPKKVLIISSKDEALFYAELKGLKVFEQLNKTVCKKTISRRRSEIQKYLLNHFKIDWDKLLPKAHLPIKFDAGALKIPTKFKFVEKSQRFRFKKSV